MDPEQENEPREQYRPGHGPRGVRLNRRLFFFVLGGAAVGMTGLVEAFRYAGGGSATGAAGTGRRGLLGDFPALNVESVPAVPPADWVLEVGGMVDKPIRLDHAAWQALPRVAETKDFHCVEGWSVSAVRWGGVALGTVLDKAGVKAGARAVVFHAHGGTYSDDLSLDGARASSVLLADTLDEAPLPPDHGGPLRLVVPTQLGYKNVKWVERIEVTDHRVTGYWEQRGYSAEAPIP